MAKGYKKSERKNPHWWKSVVAYLEEQKEPVSIRNIIGNAKTFRHNRTGGDRDTLLCKSMICPLPRDVAYIFRVRKIPYVQGKVRRYYLGEDNEDQN